MSGAEPDYMSGPHDGPKCACRHDGVRWLKRCVAAAANDLMESGRWAAHHVTVNPGTQFTAEYLALAAPYLKNSNEDLR